MRDEQDYNQEQDQELEKAWPEEELQKTFTPQKDDETTFKQRNDPETLLETIKLQLMNAYRTTTRVKDEEGQPYDKPTIKFKKGMKPRMNKKGIEDFINYLKFIINNHVVMGNLLQREDYNTRMRNISNDIASHLTIRREDWGIAMNDLDIFIAQSNHFIDLFLTRTLYNKEREAYGEGYTETRSFSGVPETKKPGLLQKASRALRMR